MFFEIATICANLAVTNFMSEVSRFAEKLKAPIPVPLSERDFTFFAHKETPYGLWASVTVTNGYGFSYRDGHFTGYSSPRQYRGLQGLDRIPDFYGEDNMTTEQAIALARETIRWAGYELEDVFAEEPPSKVTGPRKDRGNIIPIYWVEWAEPRGGDAVFVEVDGGRKLVTAFGTMTQNTYHSEYDTGEPPITASDRRKEWLQRQVNPEYVSAALPTVLNAIQEFVNKAGITKDVHYSTNQIRAMFPKRDVQNSFYISIQFTNNYWFEFKNNMVVGFAAPDRFYHFPFPANQIRIARFVGKWRLSEDESINVCRAFVRKLGYSEHSFGMDEAPFLISFPTLTSKKIIPHYQIEWANREGGATFGVDADAGMIRNMVIVNHGLIGKPLLLPVRIEHPDQMK